MENWKEMDPYILLSLLNMKLRNYYASLDILSEEEKIPKEELIAWFHKIGYHYQPNGNHFISDEIGD